MKVTRMLLRATAAIACATLAVPATATLPTPPQAQAAREAQAFLFNAGAGDIFEITTSMMAIQNSRNADVRAFASMLIAHHTELTNAALAAAKAGGVMPPPPELNAQQKAMIGQLMAAAPANWDRVYLQQQVPAHQMALTMMQGYARNGDNASLRQAATGAIPRVQQHLARAQALLRSIG